MAFYTANWVKKLVKEDHVALQAHISKKDNDFRSYIDSTLPFTLYLDIDSIVQNVLKPSSKFIQGISATLKLEDPSIVLKELHKAYQKTINYYIDSYPSVSSEELAKKLEALKLSETSGNIKTTLNTEFKKTFVIANLSKKNKSVLIVSPKFTTIQSKFGSVVKENFDYSVFSDNIDDELQNSPRNLMKAYLDKNFAVLNNLGHVEVDVISSTEGSTEVKRGLVSPRLLQALVDWPKDSKTELLVRKFSKETGQAETRIKVRKKFSGSKLVLEMLIEAGMMIGSVESQEENLRKAPKEKAFLVGKNLTSRILKDPSIIFNLETSKSISNYLVDSVLNALKGKKTQDYSSSTTIAISSKITRAAVSIATKQKKQSKVPLPNLRSTPFKTISLADLQMILNAQLQDVVSANMGEGNSRGVLNYRSGRFAESVKVERLSESRNGLITAFYSYMKNPYATFSQGGRQEVPRSRDPKLLIARSIRDIASQHVSNALRSVNV